MHQPISWKKSKKAWKGNPKGSLLTFFPADTVGNKCNFWLVSVTFGSFQEVRMALICDGLGMDERVWAFIFAYRTGLGIYSYTRWRVSGIFFLKNIFLKKQIVSIFFAIFWEKSSVT